MTISSIIHLAELKQIVKLIIIILNYFNCNHCNTIYLRINIDNGF